MNDSDKLRYVITCKPSSNSDPLIISKDDFERVERSFNVLQLSVFAEEKFDAIARNFLEFESDMLTSVLETSHVRFGSGIEQMAIKRLLNRRVTNILTATKSYIDYMKHAVKILFNDDERTYEITRQFSYHYENSFAYRVFEELRNYSQHSGFPIHMVQFSTEILHSRKGTPMKCTISPILNVVTLKSHGWVKKKVLEEIEAKGPQLNLKPLAREYIARLAKVHELFRRYVDEVSISADQFLEKMAESYIENFSLNTSPFMLYAVALRKESWTKSFPLSTGFRKYGDFLADTNQNFHEADNFIVSGEDEENN